MNKFLFIMDPLENVIPTKDTTYILMLEAESRGHEIFFTLQVFFVKKCKHVQNCRCLDY